MSKKERLKVFSVRADTDQVELAKYYKLDVAEIFRKALAETIARRESKCPTCGQKAKWEPVK